MVYGLWFIVVFNAFSLSKLRAFITKPIPKKPDTPKEL